MNKPAAKRKPVPKFRSEAKEREFWESKTVDATEYFDPAAVVTAQLKNLKPSTTSISLRLSDSLLDGIRQQANKLDVPYQSLMKIWLTEKLRESAKADRSDACKRFEGCDLPEFFKPIIARHMARSPRQHPA